MIRYRVYGQKAGKNYRTTFAVTDYLDVAELIKEHVESNYRDYVVKIRDNCEKPTFFDANGDAEA